MADIIDINVTQTTEQVTINVVNDVIQVNINQITGGGGGTGDLQDVLDNGADATVGNNTVNFNNTVDGGGISFESRIGTQFTNVYIEEALLQIAQFNNTTGKNGNIFIAGQQISLNQSNNDGTKNTIVRIEEPIAETNWEVPAKTAGSYQFASLSDIPDTSLFMQKSANGSDIPNIATFRANLGIDKITNRGDANYTILSTDKAVATNANFTAPRIFTLPLANSVNAGYEIIVADLFGGVSSTNTLTISRTGSDTINGANTVVIGAQYGMRRLISDGVSKWTFDGGVMRISDYIGTTLTPNVIVGTDANSKLQPLPTTTYPSLAELAFVKGVTSAIQTQLNNRTLNIVKRATASSPVTGTTVESILTTDEIVGNTFNTNDILQLVSARFIKTGALGTCTYRIRINTTNSLSGAVTIATLNNANIYAKIGNRTFTITGGNIRGYNFTDNGISSGQDTGTASLAEASTAYNPANSIFVFTTAQLANGGDSTICREFLITN